MFIGGTGTGKSHLATAIGVQAITRHGKRVRFYSCVELANALEQDAHYAFKSTAEQAIRIDRGTSRRGGIMRR